MKSVVKIFDFVFGKIWVGFILYSNFVMVCVGIGVKMILNVFENLVDGLLYEKGEMCMDRVLKFVSFFFDFFVSGVMC